MRKQAKRKGQKAPEKQKNPCVGCRWRCQGMPCVWPQKLCDQLAGEVRP